MTQPKIDISDQSKIWVSQSIVEYIISSILAGFLVLYLINFQNLINGLEFSLIIYVTLWSVSSLIIYFSEYPRSILSNVQRWIPLLLMYLAAFTVFRLLNPFEYIGGNIYLNVIFMMFILVLSVVLFGWYTKRFTEHYDV